MTSAPAEWENEVELANDFDGVFDSGDAFNARDLTKLTLKKDHENRPLWITPGGHVFVERFSTVAMQACDFLIAISEPLCRSEFIHEYQLTPYSLYAAASLGLQTIDITSKLAILSKNELAPELMEFIEKMTSRCGKVKLCLKKNRYFVESKDTQVLDYLLEQPEISQARIDLQERKMPPIPPEYISELKKNEFREKWQKSEILFERDQGTNYIVTKQEAGANHLVLQGTKSGKFDQNAAMGMNSDEVSLEQGKSIFSFEVDKIHVDNVRKKANAEHYPMIEEYDFKEDKLTPDLALSLKPSANIRSYQEKSLSKMFGNERARSGIIVLPCGAGKTLVGITAAATIAKNTLVFCTTGMAVDQWRRQFLKWTTIKRDAIRMFSSNHRDDFKAEDAKVVITTYSMFGNSGHRAASALTLINKVKEQEWGLIIMDEVHVAPAKTFRNCVNNTHSRCKLGLTATLIREDDKIEDLYSLVGPKLYEANWVDLQKDGHLAHVQCIEVWCDMTPEFYHAYLSEAHVKQNTRQLLYWMNPNKFRCCEALIRIHEGRGDKVLVFSDCAFAIAKYARMLNKPYIFGKTNDNERNEMLHQFQTNPKVNCLFISKIGDNSIDLPDVNVIIQISSHFGARCKEAQRFGRILRPKPSNRQGFNAFFYTLVSKDTKEVYYAAKRQRFLVDQGYAFKVLKEKDIRGAFTDLKYETQESQLELLAEIMKQDDSAGAEEREAEDGETIADVPTSRPVVNRKRGVASALSGAGDAVYSEFDRQAPPKKKEKNPLFARREKKAVEAKREAKRKA
jgi:DNA excision repair protein ERCC-3